MAGPILELSPRTREGAFNHHTVEAVHVLNPGDEALTNLLALNVSQLQAHGLMQDTLSRLTEAGKEGKSSKRIVELYHDEIRDWLDIADAEKPGMMLGVIDGLQKEGDHQRKLAAEHYQSMKRNGLGAVSTALAIILEQSPAAQRAIRFHGRATLPLNDEGAMPLTTISVTFGIGSSFMAFRSLQSLQSGVANTLAANRLAHAAQLLRESWQTCV